MRACIQRVKRAEVLVNNLSVGKIDLGFLVLVGFEAADTLEDIEYITQKITKLRIFNDEHGKMNLDIREVAGKILWISQFTLHAATKKSNRPSFIKAAVAQEAKELYELSIQKMSNLLNQKIETGIFGADMQISLVNDGPVTILLDSKNKE
jgi:D-tyrosyl-tRNA(Tyr) deacylase